MASCNEVQKSYKKWSSPTRQKLSGHTSKAVTPGLLRKLSQARQRGYHSGHLIWLFVMTKVSAYEESM